MINTDAKNSIFEVSKKVQDELNRITELLSKKRREYEQSSDLFPLSKILEYCLFDNERWNEDKQSKFIESVLLGLPIGKIILMENGKIFDGYERMTTLQKFAKNKLRLSNLKILPELNGAKIDDLPSAIKNDFKASSFKVVRIEGITRANEDILKESFN